MVKGSKMSPEARARIGASLKAAYARGTRRVSMEAARVAAADYWKGRPLDPDRRAALLAYATAPKSETHKANIGAGRRRYLLEHGSAPLTDEHKERIGAGGRKAWARVDVGERRIDSLRSSWARINRDEKLRRIAAMQYANATDEQKASRREKSRLSWERATPAERERRLSASRAKTSSLERTVAGLLDALGVAYLTHVTVDRYVVDIVVPGQKLAIECDGEYWHSLPGIPEKDARKDAHLRRCGYTVLRLKGREIVSGEAAPTLMRLVVGT